MATVDVLVTKYQMDNSDYVRGAKQVDDATMKNQRSMDSLARGIAGATTIVTGFVGAVGAATTALVALGTVSIRKSSEFDAMVKALEAIEGSAKGAGDAIEELRKIAARPGLGLEEAISGYSGLRRAGLDRDMSMRILGSAGNANALAGGGREELSRILLAITQIAMKPNLSGEELMQLNEGGIAASRIIGDAFGTFDGAELKKMGVDSREALEALVEGMEAMPQAASSAKNSLENLQMGIDMALVGIGSGLTTHLIGPLDEIGTALSNVEGNGLFEVLGDKLGTIATVVFPELTMGAETLEEQFVKMAGVIADVAQALGNLKLNVQDIAGSAKWWNPIAMWDSITGGAISGAAGDAFGAGAGVKPASEQLWDEYQMEMRLRQSQREREAEDQAQSSDPSTNPGKDPFGEPSMQIKYLMEIERNTGVMAKAMTAFSIGGSAMGNATFNTVNLSRITGSGQSNGDYLDQAANILRAGILSEIRANNRLVGF